MTWPGNISSLGQSDRQTAGCSVSDGGNGHRPDRHGDFIGPRLQYHGEVLLAEPQIGEPFEFGLGSIEVDGTHHASAVEVVVHELDARMEAAPYFHEEWRTTASSSRSLWLVPDVGLVAIRT